MKDLFDVLGLEYDRENRARVDAAIRTILKTPEDAACPLVWSRIKSLPADQRSALSSRVSALLH